jgi:hypothetical protein
VSRSRSNSLRDQRSLIKTSWTFSPDIDYETSTARFGSDGSVRDRGRPIELRRSEASRSSESSSG